MNHDAIPCDLPGPASPRAADVRRAYLRIAQEGLRRMGDRMAHDSAYTSNEHGHFAWDVSLAIRAACLMWHVTGDSAHMEQATTWAQHLADRTDEASGRIDYRGQSGPVWSAGIRYTAGTANVGNWHGLPLRLQAVAERIVVERPSGSTVQVHAIVDREKVWSSPECSVLPEDDTYLPDVLSQRSTVHSVLLDGPAAVDLSGLPAGEYDIEPQRAAHLVHTGMIARSILAVAQMLQGGPASRQNVGPDDLYRLARRALRAHDPDVRAPGGRAWYITPVDFPGRRLGLDLPHNQVVDAATSALILGRHHNDPDLWSLGASITRRFLREMRDYESGALPHPWFYYPVDSPVYEGVLRDEPLRERDVRAVVRGEDSSHATLRVRALAEWRALDSDLVSEETLRAVALSFRRFFMSNTDGNATLRWLSKDMDDAVDRGRADGYAGAWGALAHWDSTLNRRLNSLAYRNPPKSIFGATILSSTEYVALNTKNVTCDVWDQARVD